MTINEVVKYLKGRISINQKFAIDYEEGKISQKAKRAAEEDKLLLEKLKGVEKRFSKEDVEVIEILLKLAKIYGSELC